MRCLFVLSLALALSACGDPLVPPELVSEPRVYGVKVSQPEPANSREAQLGPGDSGRLEFLLASAEDVEVEVLVHVCLNGGGTLGAPACAGELLDQRKFSANSRDGITTEVALPATLKPGDDWLVWAGICVQSRVKALSSEHFACSSGDPLETFARFTVATEQASNLNPDLSDDRLLLAGQAWPEAVWHSPGAECSGSALPRVSVRETHLIRFQMAGEDREALATGASDYGAPARESLLYSHALTVPGLERAFSSIDHDSEGTTFTLELTPSELPTSDLKRKSAAATLFFVVRDDRGGSDWLRRQICIVDE